ncbi:MAG: Holliday junction branch migration protein RuvA [Treponema sp.]|nr:Holliday junction branch migration protein RuvA [Treponema sp.]
MFNSLTGTITGKFPNTVYIDTHGIEWSISVPGSAFDALPPVGQTGKVYTYLVHTQDLMSLYGFASNEERQLFLDLLKVDGIGPKAAVKILSNIAGQQLVDALDKGDVAVLEKVPGVGKKTAAKMMLALKGKLTLNGDDTVVVHRSAAGAYDAVITSLASMGYDRRDCEQTVADISLQLAKDTGWDKKKPTEKEDAVFRRALVELAQ